MLRPLRRHQAHPPELLAGPGGHYRVHQHSDQDHGTSEEAGAPPAHRPEGGPDPSASHASGESGMSMGTIINRGGGGGGQQAGGGGAGGA